MEKLALIARGALRTAALGRREGSLCSPKVFLRRQSCLKNILLMISLKPDQE